MNSFKIGKYKFVKDLSNEYPNHLIFYPTNKMYLIYDNEIYYLRYLWEFKRKSQSRKKSLCVSIQPLRCAIHIGAIESINVKEFFKDYQILTEQEIKKVMLLL